jgi:NitT/TauT family transport system substrate-binding protein
MLTDADSSAHLHQDWMMREINKLVWPAPWGIGRINAEHFSNEISLAKKIGVLPPSFSGDIDTLTDLSLIDQAVNELQVEGFDVFGYV